MVWFYRKDDYFVFVGERVFQSHYGLILSRTLPSLSNSLKNFQSHYGLILSITVYSCPLNNTIAFNPTMVWFYLQAFLPGILSGTLLSIPLWSDFIAERGCQSACSRVCFQSHYGLILSDHIYINATDEIGLSIPLWSDFISFEFLSSVSIMSNFQSHYGLILSLSSMQGLISSSIPFNPTMVWFYRDDKHSYSAR